MIRKAKMKKKKREEKNTPIKIIVKKERSKAMC
jgi:hypothetical protein